MMHSRFFGLAALALVALGGTSLCFAAEPRMMTSLEGINEYVLDNGLQVLLYPDDSKPTVTVNATYLVGSRHEGYGETGMAHLLEHMLFKGTPKHSQIWKELQEHGAQFNGSTWFDRTNYFETMPATPENLEFGLNLEADRMVNSFVAKKDLDSEFSVVRNEFEIGENRPTDVLSERVMSTAYLWHNYGKSTIGSREDIERVPIERLQAFYKKFYQPDNCVLIVAGKFDPKQTLAQVNTVFGATPRPTRTLEPTYTWEPTQDGEREVTLRRVGDTQALDVVYHVCAGAHADFAPVQVLADILATEQTGRLYKALVEPGLATRVSAHSQALHDPGVIEIEVEARLDQSAPEIRHRLAEVLDNLGHETFTQEEVDRAKNASSKNFNTLINDSNRIGVSLSESAAMGDWRLLFWNRDRIAQVTPADVQRVAARYLKPSNRTIGTFIPDKTPDRSEIPPTPDVATLLKDYHGGAEVAKGAAFEATYAGIEAHTQRSKLPFGMKLALVPKETRNNHVNVVLNLRYGSEKDLTGKTEAAAFVPTMLMRGTTKHTRREIQDAFDALKAQVRFGGFGGAGRGRMMGMGNGLGTPGVIDVSIECSRETLAKVLDLVAEVLRQPAFPADEFETLKKETLAGIEQQISEPMPLVMVEVQRRLNPYPATDVRYVAKLPEQAERIKAVTLDQVKAVFASLVGASFSEAAAVGDFDASQFTASLTQHFSDWKSPKPFERIVRPYKATAADSLVIDTPDKANSLFAMGMALEIRDDDPDYPALFMANYILGGSASSRFLNRIRQKEGLSYTCGTGVQAGAQDRNGTFMGFGMCAPQNAEKALACGREELSKLLREGVAGPELDDAKKGYAQQVEVQLANDSMVAMQLAQGLFLDRTLKFNDDQQKKIEALKAQDVPATLGKYVKPQKLVLIRAGDFSKKAAPPQQATGG